MKNQAKVVVIGGGVVGVSVLYHLTKAGWRDVMLIERAELTSGSTWHAAGGMHTVNGDPNVAKLQQYTINLYRELEQISGQSCGLHITGGLMLAGTPERLDWLKMTVARGRYLGMDLELIDMTETKKRFPLLDEKHFVGAIYDPIEGHVDPYGVTHAYAKSAQIGGAEIVRQNRVVDLKQRADGSWDVITEHGNVHAEHVVNAGGLWAREVGRMVGLELPILAMEHQYIITDDLPELAGQPELLHVIDFEGEIYMRQERGGVLLGTYERAGVPWSTRTTPWDFGQDLLPNDLERIAPSLEVGFKHFPRLGEVGIRKIVNGIRFPNEELPAARPLKTTPIYDRLQTENPVWGDYCGLEHALWFAPKGSDAREDVTFRRSNAHQHVAAECRAVRDAVGMIEISNYGKFEVTGPDAERWLARIMANKVPANGRVALTPMLNENGKLIGDFTMCRLGAERFLLVGTYAAERFYQRWFEARLAGFKVQVRACAMEWLGLSIAGPASRELLQSLVDEDLGTKAFPFMSFGAMDVGLVPALVGRLSFTGDLGYEIWVKSEFHRELYERLVAAGKPLGLRHFGGRALNSMRMEKSFGSWAREYRPIYGPFEANLDRFVDLKKADFVGRAAALAEKSSGGQRKLITLDIDAKDCDAIADEPIWLDGRVVGWVTSGAYGHSVGKSLALGYVDRESAKATTGFEVELIGDRRAAVRLESPAFDPSGQRMRA
ncbi:MAG: FAD-dependent oxidoreductase [Gammaproteobacteria bacterium]|nr:FAD-dependent oxidoreductase [Gammaproteobacteria bacterium]